METAAEPAELEKPAGEEALLARNRSFKSKLLVRSQAIRESQSPPRTTTAAHEPTVDENPAPQTVEIQITSGDNARSEETHVQQCELLSNNPRVACVCDKECRGRRRFGCPAKQDSGLGCSQECADCPDSPEILVSPAEPSRLRDPCRYPDNKDDYRPPLARHDSEEKRELSPEQLVRFIRDTLNKCRRDRAALLDIERQLTALVDDVGRCSMRFPSDTSYGRMLVHRCSELFQLRHTLDHNNKNTVVVSKTGTAGGRVPCTGFRQWCTSIFSSSPQRSEDITQAKSILKRSAHSLDEPLRACERGARRSKSFEQREQEYQRVRRRIFSREEERDSEQRWPWSSAPVRLLTADSARNSRLLKVQSLEVAAGASGDGGAGSGADRGPVSKSHSFGGYGRDEQPRILSRQGDLASSSWRLSPSSSGYKTLSLRSTDSVTPSPTGGVSPEPSGATGGAALVWAVSDVASIPPGALIIHPQTGRPVTNADGSVYRYDPAHPPVIPPLSATSDVEEYSPVIPILSTTSDVEESQVDQNGDKGRSTLEKQNSFISPDCECQSADHASETCSCCETRSRADWTHACRHAGARVPHAPAHTPTDATTHQPTERTYEATNDESPLTDRGNTHVAESGRTQVSPRRAAADDSSAEWRGSDGSSAECRRPDDSRAEWRRPDDASAQWRRPDDSSAEWRRPDDNYQYATDYGPGVSNDTLQYYLPYYQPAQQTFRVNDEMGLQPHGVTSPGFADPSHAAAAKQPPLAYDPTLRTGPMSLGGAMFTPGSVSHNGHPFANHCRTDVLLHPHANLLEPKAELSPAVCLPQSFQEPLVGAFQFQGYAGGLNPCAGAGGVDPLHLISHHQRPGGLTYGQLEPTPPPAYHVPGVILPQHHLHPYQFGAPTQWPWQPMLAPPACAPPQKPPTPPMFVQQLPQELFPLHNSVYPVVGYPNVYQQFVPGVQHLLPGYPVCQPFYGAGEQQSRRNSVVRPEQQAFRARPEPRRRSLDQSARATPAAPAAVVADDKHVGQMYGNQYDQKLESSADSPRRHQLSKQSSVDSNPDPRRFRGAPKPQVSRQNSAGSELAAKIQQIKEHMTGLNVNGNGDPPDVTRGAPRQPPANYTQPPPRSAVSASAHDSAQLSSAARAIVNSLRGATRHGTTRHDARRRPDCPANFQRAPQAQYRYNFNSRQDLRRATDRNEDHASNDRTAGPNGNQAERDPGPQGPSTEAEGHRRGQDVRTDGQMAVSQRRDVNPVVQYQYGRPPVIRQMTAGSWFRRSPGPANFGNGPRRGAPDRRR